MDCVKNYLNTNLWCWGCTAQCRIPWREEARWTTRFWVIVDFEGYGFARWRICPVVLIIGNQYQVYDLERQLNSNVVSWIGWTAHQIQNTPTCGYVVSTFQWMAVECTDWNNCTPQLRTIWLTLTTSLGKLCPNQWLMGFNVPVSLVLCTSSLLVSFQIQFQQT